MPPEQNLPPVVPPSVVPPVVPAPPVSTESTPVIPPVEKVTQTAPPKQWAGNHVVPN